MLHLSVTYSILHEAKALQIDSDIETMAVIGLMNESLGILSWDAVIDFIQHTGSPPSPRRPIRQYSRSQLAVTLRYIPLDHNKSKAVTSESGGGGIFIETFMPAQIGTLLALEIILPDDLARPIIAQGQVAWMRSLEEPQVSAPGMGVKFIEISEDSQACITNLVKCLNQSRGYA